VFDPNVAGTIYTIQNNRIYRTADAGESWQLQPEVSPAGYYGVAVPPGRPGRIFASGWNTVLRSDEGIGQWKPLDVALYRAAFVIDPQRPDTVFAVDNWIGTPMAVSHDSGDTWRTVTAPTSSTRGPTIDPLRPATLFVAGGLRSLPYLIQFDASVTSVRYASYVTMAVPLAAVSDPSGGIYLLGGTSLAITKLQPPQILNPSRSGSR
jgi:hypothetical protein